MAELPWTKIYHDEFLQGCRAANLKADEIGVYTTVLLLISSRGSPIEDDRQWLAAMSGCSTRRCGQILERLTQIPNKLVLRNGMIGNVKMLRILADRDKKSSQARQAALARWHGDEAELPLSEPAKPKQKKIISNLSANKNGDKSEIKTRKKGHISQNSAKTDDADASPPVRARDSEAQSIHPSPPNPLVDAGSIPEGPDGMGPGGNPIDRLGDSDLAKLYQAVATASGHNPSSPGQIDRAYRFIQKWKDEGVDFDQVVIPTIRSMITSSNDPTRTLGRFDARILHEHARLGATTSSRPYLPPESPVLEPEGEDKTFRPLRDALLKKMGAIVYSTFLNHVRFEEVTDVGGKDRRVMRVRYARKSSIKLMDGDRIPIVTREARALGFTDVW